MLQGGSAVTEPFTGTFNLNPTTGVVVPGFTNYTVATGRLPNMIATCVRPAPSLVPPLSRHAACLR